MSKEHITLQSSCVLPSFHLTLEITKGSRDPLWRHLTLIHWHITLIHTLYYVFPFFNFFLKGFHLKYGLYKSQIITVTSKHSITAAHYFLVASHQCCNLKGRCCLVAICIFVCCASFLFSFLPQTKHWQRFQAAFGFFASIRYLYISVWFLKFRFNHPVCWKHDQKPSCCGWHRKKRSLP